MDTWPLDDVMRVVASAAVSRITHRGYIAQWSERLTADQQVPDSNPGVPSFGNGGADENFRDTREPKAAPSAGAN